MKVLLKALFFIFIFSISSVVLAAPAANDFSAIRALGVKNQFVGQNQIPINSYFYSKGLSSKLIIVSPGWSEPALLYLEFVKDFLVRGYDIAILDHRGQGESGRFLDCQCSHVDSFQNYVADLVSFIEQSSQKSKYKEVILFGHSMGGAIAALAAHQRPERIDKLVLSAPLFQTNTREIPLWLAQALTKSLVLFGFGESRRPFDKDRTPSFETNKWTQSKKRWQLAKRTGDSLSVPKIRYFTNQWLNEVFKMTGEIQKKGGDLFVRPTLLLQAETDYFVSNEAHSQICGASSLCRIEKIPKSWHSLFLDEDRPRLAAIEATEDFLSEKK